jgi:hypothetical protein
MVVRLLEQLKYYKRFKNECTTGRVEQGLNPKAVLLFN